MISTIQLSMLSSKADKGDAAAQYQLAEMYRQGKTGQPSISTAMKYYVMAARQNHPEALYYLAECQDRGRAVEQNTEYAFQNYLKAAKLGHVEAAVSVGHFYEVGRATYKNVETAKQYYQYAASKGHAGAVKKLSDLNSANTGASASTSPMDARQLDRENRQDDAKRLATLRKLAMDAVSRCDDVNKLELIIKALR